MNCLYLFKTLVSRKPTVRFSLHKYQPEPYERILSLNSEVVMVETNFREKMNYHLEKHSSNNIQSESRWALRAEHMGETVHSMMIVTGSAGQVDQIDLYNNGTARLQTTAGKTGFISVKSEKTEWVYETMADLLEHKNALEMLSLCNQVSERHESLIKFYQSVFDSFKRVIDHLLNIFRIFRSAYVTEDNDECDALLYEVSSAHAFLKVFAECILTNVAVKENPYKKSIEYVIELHTKLDRFVKKRGTDRRNLFFILKDLHCTWVLQNFEREMNVWWFDGFCDVRSSFVRLFSQNPFEKCKDMLLKVCKKFQNSAIKIHPEFGPISEIGILKNPDKFLSFVRRNFLESVYTKKGIQLNKEQQEEGPMNSVNRIRYLKKKGSKLAQLENSNEVSSNKDRCHFESIKIFSIYHHTIMVDLITNTITMSNNYTGTPEIIKLDMLIKKAWKDHGFLFILLLNTFSQQGQGERTVEINTTFLYRYDLSSLIHDIMPQKDLVYKRSNEGTVETVLDVHNDSIYIVNGNRNIRIVSLLPEIQYQFEGVNLEYQDFVGVPTYLNPYGDENSFNGNVEVLDGAAIGSGLLLLVCRFCNLYQTKALLFSVEDQSGDFHDHEMEFESDNSLSGDSDTSRKGSLKKVAKKLKFLSRKTLSNQKPTKENILWNQHVFLSRKSLLYFSSIEEVILTRVWKKKLFTQKVKTIRPLIIHANRSKSSTATKPFSFAFNNEDTILVDHTVDDNSIYFQQIILSIKLYNLNF